MGFSQQYKTKTEATLISHHASQRMNQRGIRYSLVDVILHEGSIFESRKKKGRSEVFFSRKDRSRVENKIRSEIRELMKLQKKKLCGKVIGNQDYGMSRTDISEKISEKKAELRQVSKLTNKLVVVENNYLVTCFHKNKNYLKNQRRRTHF